MPYIKEDRREKMDRHALPANTGELNYTITQLCLDYIQNWGLSYAAINEVVGVLTCVIQELYRRVAVPYEAKKIAENGDVYPDKLIR
jgi:hypothetical protein